MSINGNSQVDVPTLSSHSLQRSRAVSRPPPLSAPTLSGPVRPVNGMQVSGLRSRPPDVSWHATGPAADQGRPRHFAQGSARSPGGWDSAEAGDLPADFPHIRQKGGLVAFREQKVLTDGGVPNVSAGRF